MVASTEGRQAGHFHGRKQSTASRGLPRAREHRTRSGGGSMRAAIYARVSTSDQNNTIQVRELTEYVQRRGWELTVVYQDQMSGAKASRPGLDRLVADARVRR